MKRYFKLIDLSKTLFSGLAVVLLASCSAVQQGAPDLGPGFTQVKDGISVFVPDQTTKTKIFDEYKGFYTLLLKRVGELAAKGKAVAEVKKELKMPEYADWNGQDRLPAIVAAADKSVMK